MQDTINVLHIIRKPVIGGAEMLVKNIINKNYLEPHYKHFMLYSFEGPLIKLFPQELYDRLIHIQPKNKLKLILKLRKAIKKHRISIVHTHQPIDGIIAIIATIGLNIKTIRSYHGFEGIYYKTDKPSIKSRIIYFLINRYVTLNIFVSATLLKYYQKRNPKQPSKRQAILYNGIDDDELIKSNPVSLRNELNIVNNSIVLGMIGGFSTKGRDQFTLCRAMKILLKFKANIHLIFIGKRNNSEIYKKCYNYCINNKIIDNVHFLGEKNDIGGLLKSMDVYVHSSNNDTFGLALVEAMLCNVPCIASDISAFREISKNGKFITLFEKGNAKDLVSKIEKTLDNFDRKALNHSLKKTEKYAKENFAISTHLSNLHNLYNQCLKS